MRNKLTILCLFFTSVIQAQTTAHYTTEALFCAGDGEYYNYRVPSLVVSSKGTILAFCAARYGTGGDWDPINIVLRRSLDNGKTWEAMQVIVSKDSLPCDNATPIVDYHNKIVHLLYQIGYRECFYIRSSDEGQTWTKPINITPAAEALRTQYPWLIIAPGPGHGIQLRSGRLVVPVWFSTGGTEEQIKTGKLKHRPSIVSSLYSDDYGETWKVGDIAVPDNEVSVIPNETSCVELADGTVVFNSRNESINYRRLMTYSPDGASRWSIPVFDDSFFEPICFGSMCRLTLQPAQSKNRILFCNPDSRHNAWVADRRSTPRSAPSRRRENLTLRMSYDEGLTWPVKKTLNSGISGYSDLAVSLDGKIFCLYEDGSMQGEEGSHYKTNRLTLASFNLEWLTEGKDFIPEKELPLR